MGRDTRNGVTHINRATVSKNPTRRGGGGWTGLKPDDLKIMVYCNFIIDALINEFVSYSHRTQRLRFKIFCH